VQQSAVSRIAAPADFLPAEAKEKKETVTCERTPTAEEYDDLIFGWNNEADPKVAMVFTGQRAFRH